MYLRYGRALLDSQLEEVFGTSDLNSGKMLTLTEFLHCLHASQVGGGVQGSGKGRIGFLLASEPRGRGDGERGDRERRPACQNFPRPPWPTKYSWIFCINCCNLLTFFF